MKTIEKIYQEYEFLAKKYANKIFSYEQLSYEYEDLVQEFRIKIFTSIKSYQKRLSKYENGEANKPVPIQYYIETACANKMYDFMKYISRENNKLRIDDIHYDFGVEDTTSIQPGGNVFIINNIDLLENLQLEKRAVFSLFLRGYKKNDIVRFFSNKFSSTKVISIIEEQKKYLIEKYGNDLIEKRKMYITFSLEE